MRLSRSDQSPVIFCYSLSTRRNRGRQTVRALVECAVRVMLIVRDYRKRWPAWPGRCYQRSFRPNWIWREVVAVEVMTPAVGEGPPVAAANTTGFGVFKFV